jgi:hypothetical protein
MKRAAMLLLALGGGATVLTACGGGTSAQSPATSAPPSSSPPGTVTTQATAATCDGAMASASANPDLPLPYPPPLIASWAGTGITWTLYQCPSKTQWIESAQPYVGPNKSIGDLLHHIASSNNPPGPQRDRDIAWQLSRVCYDRNRNFLGYPACVNP